MVASSTMSPEETTDYVSSPTEVSIPAQLKFFMSNIKTLVTVQLTIDNHLIWKSQLLKLFIENNFEGYLKGTMVKPLKLLSSTDGSSTLNPLYTSWLLIDQHLASAIYSTISASLLPYILNLETTHDIWMTLERRLQSSNCSRILQLKNELHQLQLGDKTMFQYLSDIKDKVDAIAGAGAHIDSENIIHYTLNGLPNTYQSFKTSIQNQLLPITLDDFYVLLCSEELHITVDSSLESVTISTEDSNFALSATRGSFHGCSSFNPTS
ncbi:hypothetical protein KFK09_014077 [Dendrobium nobile]|uniref:Retrovirus-related Pol polyprotein from transposon TNT 1-94 n=1 Tax=Dendrobium nobile TaxID=94219 RepID=A0A8T3BER2_DENNO|nr:hypothetical protein KFK09_014077 [Dendrobium nobile]